MRTGRQAVRGWGLGGIREDPAAYEVMPSWAVVVQPKPPQRPPNTHPPIHPPAPWSGLLRPKRHDFHPGAKYTVHHQLPGSHDAPAPAPAVRAVGSQKQPSAGKRWEVVVAANSCSRPGGRRAESHQAGCYKLFLAHH